MKKNTILLVVCVVLVLVAGGEYAYKIFHNPTYVTSENAPQANVVGATVITLTSDGWKPSEVTIKQGNTITFKNTTGNKFWPASNLHPSHLLYPEFDPKQPIAADASWSFVFTKIGAWQFHDHLAPYFTGIITVTP